MYKIDQEACMACTICVDSCPANAIVPNEGGKFSINEDCFDCGACVGTCPVNAIVPATEEAPAEGGHKCGGCGGCCGGKK